MRYLIIVCLLLNACVFDDPYLARELGRTVVRTVAQPN